MPLNPTIDAIANNGTDASAPTHTARLKMLSYRSWHRGTREADFLIGPFADAHLAGFSKTQLAAFEQLLNVADDKLTAWIMMGEAAPAPFESELLAAMRRFQTRNR